MKERWISLWRKSEKQQELLNKLSWHLRLAEAGIELKDITRIEARYMGTWSLVEVMPSPRMAVRVSLSTKAPPIYLSAWL